MQVYCAVAPIDCSVRTKCHVVGTRSVESCVLRRMSSRCPAVATALGNIHVHSSYCRNLNGAGLGLVAAVGVGVDDGEGKLVAGDTGGSTSDGRVAGVVGQACRQTGSAVVLKSYGAVVVGNLYRCDVATLTYRELLGVGGREYGGVVDHQRECCRSAGASFGVGDGHRVVIGIGYRRYYCVVGSADAVVPAVRSISLGGGQYGGVAKTYRRRAGYYRYRVGVDHHMQGGGAVATIDCSVGTERPVVGARGGEDLVLGRMCSRCPGVATALGDIPIDNCQRRQGYLKGQCRVAATMLAMGNHSHGYDIVLIAGSGKSDVASGFVVCERYCTWVDGYIH